MGDSLQKATTVFKSELGRLTEDTGLTEAIMELLEHVTEAAAQEGFEHGRHEYKLDCQGCTPVQDSGYLGVTDSDITLSEEVSDEQRNNGN